VLWGDATLKAPNRKIVALLSISACQRRAAGLRYFIIVAVMTFANRTSMKETALQ
jgi:hypothetical protein